MMILVLKAKSSGTKQRREVTCATEGSSRVEKRHDATEGGGGRGATWHSGGRHRRQEGREKSMPGLRRKRQKNRVFEPRTRGIDKKRDQRRKGSIAVKRRSQSQSQRTSRRDESGRDESGRDESGRDESGRNESGRDESGRDESGRNESGRNESGRDESGRDESGRKKSGRNESGRRMRAEEVSAEEMRAEEE